MGDSAAIRIRWLSVRGTTGGSVVTDGAAAPRGQPEAESPAPASEPVPVDGHAVSNAVTAIVGAARLLHDRWDDLPEDHRRELSCLVARRADDLRVAWQVRRG